MPDPTTPMREKSGQGVAGSQRPRSPGAAPSGSATLPASWLILLMRLLTTVLDGIGCQRNQKGSRPGRGDLPGSLG